MPDVLVRNSKSPSFTPATTPAATTPAPNNPQSSPYVPAPPANGGNAMADPAYQAYLRGMGVEEAEITNILNTRVGALTRQLGRKLPAYAEAKAQAIKGTGQEYEGRGFFRSGNRVQEQARVGRESDRERMDYEADVRDQIAELYGVSAMDIARLRREQAEQAILGAQNTAINNANAGIY